MRRNNSGETKVKYKKMNKDDFLDIQVYTNLIKSMLLTSVVNFDY